MNGAIPNVLARVPCIERLEMLNRPFGTGAAIMLISAFLGMMILPLPASTQDAKRIVLSPKSNISTSEVAEGFQKYCPNVLVTEDPGKADFTLEAAQEVTLYQGDSVRRWHFTLLNKDGDVIFTTHPKFSLGNRFAHHFEDTCKFINGRNDGKKKK